MSAVFSWQRFTRPNTRTCKMWTRRKKSHVVTTATNGSDWSDSRESQATPAHRHNNGNSIGSDQKSDKSWGEVPRWDKSRHILSTDIHTHMLGNMRNLESERRGWCTVWPVKESVCQKGVEKDWNQDAIYGEHMTTATKYDGLTERLWKWSEWSIEERERNWEREGATQPGC